MYDWPDPLQDKEKGGREAPSARYFLLPHLSVSVNNVFGAGELLQTHGSPGVHLLGGDADLGAQTELVAVGEVVEALTYTAAASTWSRNCWAAK